MAIKKKERPTVTDFIHMGNLELDKQTPAQRGIHLPPAPARKAKDEAPKRERFTVNISPGLIQRARMAVVHTIGLTLSGLMEEAITREIDRREKANGKPFPATSSASPKKGRPIIVK